MSAAKEQREKLTWEFPNIGKKAPEQEERHSRTARDIRSF